MKELWKQDRTAAVLFALAITACLVRGAKYVTSPGHLTVSVGGAFLLIAALTYALAGTLADIKRLKNASRA